MKRVSHHGDITERRLEVEETEERGGVQRSVILIQLSSWPPGELPHPTAILSLVDLLSKAQRSSPSRHTVIMCRSETLIFSIPSITVKALTVVSDTLTFRCLKSSFDFIIFWHFIGTPSITLCVLPPQ